MKVKFLVLPAILTAVSFIGQTVFAKAQAAPVCRLSTLNSVYGAQAAGTIVSDLAPLTPGAFGGIGLFIFDGNGGFSGNNTVSFNGTSVSRTFVGTYQVQPNCTASFTYTDSSNFSTTAIGVIVNKGKKVLIIQTVPAGSVITGSFEKL
ncbi:hypothetical protein IQ276_027960 [Desmonostoc muscorum LEGE 12446]|uniref:Uncharacterized protein n=1 Tax=Desmonostoc muscorum LEGE 12446 TaxID=1828758 RepID=A0A8J7A9U2_DESMC|nr:hypothetical protein [Desmonostoc muscorum]MCF2150198.1 hypothetical protein [Desmonostoc muscorum LEGE 12446]